MFKHLSAGFAALLASAAASAGTLTGNVAVVSDYLFRGVDQSAQGAAVQGGVDYSSDFGAYAGLWVTNAAVANGNEADVYAGYTLQLGEFTLDAGAIYYAYTEDTEGGGPCNTTTGRFCNRDYAEIYVGGGIGPLALKLFYAPEFGGDVNGSQSGDSESNELLYVTASATLALSETVSFVPQIGLTTGDGAEDAFGDGYLDYSFTATKHLENDFSASLAVIGTDRELAGPGTASDDNAKFVVGIKKHFKI